MGFDKEIWRMVRKGVVFKDMAVLTKVTEATDGHTSITAANLLKGYMSRTNCTVGGKTLTFPTATLIQAAFSAKTGAWFTWMISNTSTQTITLTTAAGLTLKGTAAVPNAKTAFVTFINTAVGAIDVVIFLAA